MKLSFYEMNQLVNKQNQQPSSPQQYAEQVANEFLQQVGTDFPSCPLGQSHSGNCSWFAKRFHEWSLKNNKGKTQIVFFIWGKKEESAHIVPVLNGYILDYIQEFSQNTPFKISPIGNPQQNKVLPLDNLPGDVSAYYKKWYDEFIFGENISEIESVMHGYMKEKYKENKPFQVGPYVQPQKQATQFYGQVRNNY